MVKKLNPESDPKIIWYCKKSSLFADIVFKNRHILQLGDYDVDYASAAGVGRKLNDQPFVTDPRVWRTDGRTQRQTDRRTGDSI